VPEDALTAGAIRIELAGNSLEMLPHAQISAVVAAPSAHAVAAAQTSFVGALVARSVEIAPHAELTYEDGYGCWPLTCKMLGVTCGVFPDGCGGLTSCGSCTEPQLDCVGIDLRASRIPDDESGAIGRVLGARQRK
jgi:hypothetical protein